MKSNNRPWMLMLFVYACAVILVANHALAVSTGKARQVSHGERAKVSGLILSRDGDLIRVHDKKSGEVVVITIEDTTKVERIKYNFPFYRHFDMDVTALLPGLTIEAEGVGNSAGQLDAHKISFSPDDFAIEVAEEQQVVANKAAAQRSEASAEQAAKDATQAQTSADQAQNSAGHRAEPPPNRQASPRRRLGRSAWPMPPRLLELTSAFPSSMATKTSLKSMFFSRKGQLSWVRPPREIWTIWPISRNRSTAT